MIQDISAAVCSHKGNVRNNNEDNFFLNGLYMELRAMDAGGLWTLDSEDDCLLFAVCDGMGGQESGELASTAAVSGLAEALAELRRGADVRHTIDEAVARINQAVLAIDDGKSGSTAVLLCARKGVATVANLGDSRAYLLRDGKLRRLTQDHTEVQRLINLGVVSPQEAETHYRRHALTRYLGLQMDGFALTPQYAKDIPLKQGDVFLLCSDGLTEMLGDEAIATLLAQEPADSCRALVQAALEAGGRDNVTVLALRVLGCKKQGLLFGCLAHLPFGKK